MSEWHTLNIRLQMESLITEREGITATNQICIIQGRTPQHGETAFQRIQQCFESLLHDLREIGG